MRRIVMIPNSVPAAAGGVIAGKTFPTLIRRDGTATTATTTGIIFAVDGAKRKAWLPLTMGAQVSRNARARGDVVVHLHSRFLTFVLKSSFTIGLGRTFFVLLRAAVLTACGNAWETIVGPRTSESLLSGARFGHVVAVLHGAAVVWHSMFRGRGAICVTLSTMGRPMILRVIGFNASESLLSGVRVETVSVGKSGANVMGRPITLSSEDAMIVTMGRPMT